MFLASTAFIIHLIFTGVILVDKSRNAGSISLVNEMTNQILPSLKSYKENITITDFNFFFADDGINIIGIDFLLNEESKTAILLNGEELFSFIYHYRNQIENNFYFFKESDDYVCIKHKDFETCYDVMQIW